MSHDLKSTFRAATVQEAERQLVDFARRWDKRYLSISAGRGGTGNGVIPFSIPAGERKIVHTTTAIETLYISLGKALRRAERFPQNRLPCK
jgi:putative transposase